MIKKIATGGNRDWFVFFIFLLAISIRILYIFQVLQFPLTEFLVESNTFDQYDFDKKALSISSGNWLGGNEVFGKEPLYYYFLAAIYKLFGYSHLAVYLIQALLTAIGAILIYKITSQLFNRAVGYIASLILALYAMSIFYDAILLRASLITFLNILLFYLILKADRDNRPMLWFLAGMSLGFSMLTRQNILLPFILLFILTRARSFKKGINIALIFIAGLFIIVSPVLVRNYIVSDGNRIGISSQTDAFWVGNVYDSSGIDFEPDTATYKNLHLKTNGHAEKILPLFFNELKARPKEYLQLYTRKIWMFFNGYEAPSNTNYYLYRSEFPTILRWPFFNFRFICGLALIGFFLSLSRLYKPHLAYIFFIVLSISLILFHILSRYRLPVVPYFIMFASYAVYFIFNMLLRRRLLKSVAIILTAIFFYVIFKPDLTYAGFRDKFHDKIRPTDRTNLALAYIEDYKKFNREEMLDLALGQCRIALAKDKTSYVPYCIRGYIYFLEERLAESKAEYKKALIFDNDNPFLYNELAGVHYASGDHERAFLYTKRALKFFPDNKVFKKNLALLKFTL